MKILLVIAICVAVSLLLSDCGFEHWNSRYDEPWTYLRQERDK